MAVVSYTPDYFRLWIENTIDQGYFKNGNSRVGEYKRDATNFYTAEVLFASSTAGIPSGSTITSVTVDFNIASTTLAGSQTLNLVEQNKGSWSDNGSTTPIFNAFPQTAWTNVLASISVSTSTGAFSISSTSALVSLYQAFVDGTKTAADGMVFSMDPLFFGWYITINSIQINVTYTPPVSSGGGGFFLLAEI